jgi:hypothetical protein
MTAGTLGGKIQDCLKKGPKEIVQWESAFERIMDDGKLQSLVRPSLRVVVLYSSAHNAWV